MERGQRDEVAQSLLYAGVDDHRVPEPFAPVDDAVSDRVGPAEIPVECLAELSRVDRRLRRRHLSLG